MTWRRGGEAQGLRALVASYGRAVPGLAGDAMTLHIILWLWKGWRPVYDRRDVAYMMRQLRSHGDLPKLTRVLCLTDVPTDWYKATNDNLGILEMPLWPELPGLKMPGPSMPAYPWLPTFKGTPNCFRRLKIFDVETQASLGIKPGDLVLSMDLDSIVGGSVSALMEPFYNPLGGVDFMAMTGRVSKYHGSMFAFRAGTMRHVWETFDPVTSPPRLRNPPLGEPRHVGSDQAWLSTVVENCPTWDERHNVYTWGRHYLKLRPSDPVTYMSFAGNVKPRGSMVALHLPWLHAHAMRHWEE